MVENITFDDIKHLVALAKREGVSPTDARGAEWFSVRKNGEIVAFASLLSIPFGHRLRADWTHKNYRGMGLHTELTIHRLMLCEQRCSNAEVFSRLPSYWQKFGFKIISTNEHGVSKLQKRY